MKVFNLILALAVLEPVVNHAQLSNDSAESKLMAMEAIEKIQAPRAGDFKALDALLDEAFAGVGSEGKVLDKTAVLVHLRAPGRIEFVPNSMAVRLHDDTAIVTGLYWTRGVQRGKPFVRRERFVDTWLYRRGQWVAIASLSTPAGHIE